MTQGYEAGLDAQVAAALADLKLPAPRGLATSLRTWLGKNRTQS